MSKLGCYYLHTFYPSNLFLMEEANFGFEHLERKFLVKLVRHFKSMIVNDFGNSIVKAEGISNYQPKNVDISIGKHTYATVLEKDVDTASVIIDYGEHYHKEYYTKEYTELVILFETEHSLKNVDIAHAALKYFIACYRLISHDILTLPLEKITYLCRVTRESFVEYNDEELKLDSTTRLTKTRGLKLGVKQVMFPFWNTQGKKFNTDPKLNGEKLATYFSNKTTPDIISEFILKAREELYIHNNFKYSFIESWTVLEVRIVSYLREIKLAKGISKTKIDAFETEVGISYLINIELPLTFHDAQNSVFKTLLSKVDGIRRIRNKLIHYSREISEEEAKQALETTIEFVNFLNTGKAIMITATVE